MKRFSLQIRQRQILGKYPVCFTALALTYLILKSSTKCFHGRTFKLPSLSQSDFSKSRFGNDSRYPTAGFIISDFTRLIKLYS